MYINLDVLLRIGQIVLVAAGCAVLMYLAVLFRNLAETVKSATKTLDILSRDLEKLESPLQTVDEISNTMDELHASAKKAADTAISTFTAGMDSLKTKFEKGKSETAPRPVQMASDGIKADFQPIVKETAAEEIIIVQEAANEKMNEQTSKEDSASLEGE